MTADRRLGQREPMEGVAVTWRADAVRRRFRKGPQPVTARVVDLSVTGAGVVLAAADPEAVPGAHVVLELDGARAEVVVQHLQQRDGDPPAVLYGVSFHQAEQAFVDAVYERLAATRPADLEERWNRAE